MSLVIAGKTHVFEATFRDSSGTLANPDSITIDMERPDHTNEFTDHTPTTNPSAGRFTYEWDAPSEAMEGEWGIEWTAIRDGVPATGTERFDVLQPNTLITSPVNVSNLRLLLWEKIPTLGTEDDTMFSDAELSVFLILSNEIMNRAAAIGWAVKGGYFSQQVDIMERGSNRRLQQLYENAQKQWKIFDTVAAREEKLALEALLRLGPPRVVGQAFCLLRPNVLPAVALLFDRYGWLGMNTRMFPIHRFFTQYGSYSSGGFGVLL